MVSRHSARDSQWLHTSPSLPQQQQQQQHRHHQQQYHYHSRENSINSLSTNHTYQHNHHNHSKSHSYPDLTSSGQHSPSFSNHHYNSSRTSPQTHFSSPATYKADSMMSSHQVSLFEGSPPLNTSRSSGNGQSHQHHHPQQQYHPARQQQQQMGYAPQHQAHGSISNSSMNALAKTQQQLRPLSNPKRRIPKEKAPKGDREEVWPPEVESAFMKALEVLPKLGRRKVLVNGKPCGRNELIADFIYQETGKIRDRKQVSSHIQVLKNTRKNDPEFMKLLSDTGDGDDDMMHEGAINNIGYLSSSQSPNETPLLQNDPMESALFDSRGMQHLSQDPMSPIGGGHPHGQDGYNSYSESLSTSSSAYYRQQQQQQFHGSSSGIIDPEHLYDDQASVTTPDSAISLSSQHSIRDPAFAMLDPLSEEPLHLSSAHTPIVGRRDLFRSPPPPPMPHHYSHQNQPSYPLWPTAFRLFTQYLSAESKHQFNHDYNNSSPPGNGSVQIRDLARLQDLNQNTFGTINIHHLSSEKFPHLFDLYQKEVACEFLLFKISMNLDLELEGGTFENCCLFESNDSQRTVRCSTLIYSFGAKVLESTEIKQAGTSGGAVVGGGKCAIGFQFVNQFFTAFLSGIRTLGTLDEVQVALSNLSIVQIYEEVDPVVVNASGAAGAPGATVSNGSENGGSPLLVMAFEFQQGNGSVVPYFVTEGSDMLDSLMC